MSAKLLYWVERLGAMGTHTHVYLADGSEIPNVIAVTAAGGSYGELKRFTIELLDVETERLDGPPSGREIEP